MYTKIMSKLWLNFVRDEEGASAIEYGLIVGLIAVVLIVVLQALGVGLNEMFSGVTEQLPDTSGGGEGG